MSKMSIKTNEGWEQLDFSDEMPLIYNCKGDSNDCVNITNMINNFFDNGIEGTKKLIITGNMNPNINEFTSNAYININSQNERKAILFIDFWDCEIDELNYTGDILNQSFIRISGDAAVSISGLKINSKLNIGFYIMTIQTSNNVYLNNCSFINESNFTDRNGSVITIYIGNTSSGINSFNDCYINSKLSSAISTTSSIYGIYITNSKSQNNISNLVLDFNNEVTTGIIRGIYVGGTTQTIVNITNSTITIAGTLNTNNVNGFYINGPFMNAQNTTFNMIDARNTIYIYGGKGTFTNCTFNTNDDGFCVQFQNSKNEFVFKFIGCIFNGGYGVWYNSANGNRTIIINSCNFNNTNTCIHTNAISNTNKFNIISNTFSLSNINAGNDGFINNMINENIYMPINGNAFNAITLE